jgi:arsenate reductase
MLTLLYYARCDTCRKAKKWLDEHQISYQLRDIKEAPPTAEELARWQEASGLPLKQFFNTSGQLYRSMGLKDRLPAMDEAAMRALLATDGMLVKRPLLVGAEWTRVGFRPEQWAETLGVAP